MGEVPEGLVRVDPAAPGLSRRRGRGPDLTDDATRAEVERAVVRLITG